jgi:hypothetical protein
MRSFEGDGAYVESRFRPDDFPIDDDVRPSSRKDWAWVTARTATGPILDGNWLAKNFLPRHGLGAFFGRPGCGKSVIATDIALHIAAGAPWRGIKVTSGGVTYIASEAGKLGVNRVYAWCKQHGRSWPANFRMSPVTLNMRSTEDDTRALATDIKTNQPNCVLIIIDTLARNFEGGNENGSEDMGAFVARMALLEQLTKAFVAVVHHSGKDEAKGLRGHTSLIGALDFAAEAKRELGLPGILQVTKLRDGQDGAEYGFAVASVDLGADADGDRVTDHAKPTPVGTGFPDPGKVQCVDLAAFHLFAEGKMPHKTDKERAKAVREAIEAMLSKGLLCANGGVIWRLKS